MNGYVRTIITSVFSAAVVSAGIIFATKTAFEKYADFYIQEQLDQKKAELEKANTLLIDAKKAELGRKNGQDLERLTSELNIHEAEASSSFERKIAFERAQLNEFYWPIYLRLKKDDDVWKDVFKSDLNKLPHDVRVSMEKNFILPNHSEIMKIIQNKYYLAGITDSKEDQEFEDLILKYVRHVAVYQGLRSSPVYENKEPNDYGADYPYNISEEFKKTDRLYYRSI